MAQGIECPPTAAPRWLPEPKESLWQPIGEMAGPVGIQEAHVDWRRNEFIHIPKNSTFC